jgi:transketolase
MIGRGFQEEKLDDSSLAELKVLGRLGRGDILTMTTLAGSGHPGGSMSSLEMFLILYHLAKLTPKRPDFPGRDRIVISHGHTSPGAYAALGRAGFFPIEAAVLGFRALGTVFEGHVERNVPGIEWSTGNLGQGLSAGCGFALAGRLLHLDFQVFVVMGCGEQQKGQISEARRFAVKYGLTNITGLIDYNNRQISGVTREIMPQNIKANWEADGWKVVELDGHDLPAIYQALRAGRQEKSRPTLILAHTVMGKDVSFMEGKEKWHGAALPDDLYTQAMEELGLSNVLPELRERRKKGDYPRVDPARKVAPLRINPGEPRSYGPEAKTDNRSSWGGALEDIAKLNCGVPGQSPVAVLDCDLAGSVKTTAMAKSCPQHFFQGGIQEHHTATLAGALSIMGVLTFFADFGVFGICETYNQARLNDINGTQLKVVLTHTGLDVGEDGKTHQCIDFLGLAGNLFGFQVIVPADPNQTDRAVRHLAVAEGNFLLAMGRSRQPVLCDEAGQPHFADGYRFEYGKMEKLREGDQGAILAMGPMTGRALSAWKILQEKGARFAVYNVPCPLALKPEELKEAAATGLLITYEDHHAATGLGSRVAYALADLGLPVKLVRLGIKGYGASAKPEELWEEMGLGVGHLVAAALESRRR